LIVVLSDFGSDEPIGPWRRVARRHDTIALRIVHPLEEKLPAAGLLALEDAESGKTLVVDASSHKQRSSYAGAAQERRQAFHRWCASAGVDGLTISTEDEPILSLIELFSRRRARRGAH
jgi:uncharacterized protein (DUF58 family)